jgi:hypothetical protein
MVLNFKKSDPKTKLQPETKNIFQGQIYYPKKDEGKIIHWLDSSHRMEIIDIKIDILVAIINFNSLFSR